MEFTNAVRVLIVEDESLLAMMVEEVLTGEGLQVIANVGSVPAAMHAVEQGGFDIALLDVNIAGGAVFSVADAVLERGLSVVFATGYGIKGIRADLQHLPVIGKPFSPDHLVRVLRAVAEQHSQPTTGVDWPDASPSAIGCRVLGAGNSKAAH